MIINVKRNQLPVRRDLLNKRKCELVSHQRSKILLSILLVSPLNRQQSLFLSGINLNVKVTCFLSIHR
jgi:hypothetical protein